MHLSWSDKPVINRQLIFTPASSKPKRKNKDAIKSEVYFTMNQINYVHLIVIIVTFIKLNSLTEFRILLSPIVLMQMQQFGNI